MATALANACMGCVRNAAAIFEPVKATNLPAFLCPALIKSGHSIHLRSRKPLGASAYGPQRRLLQSSTHTEPKQIHHDTSYIMQPPQLPQQCSGCGTLSQITDDKEPGFYSLNRRSMKAFLGATSRQSITKRLVEEQVVETSLRNVEEETLKSLRIHALTPFSQENCSPLCDRCHGLLHHGFRVSINHPSIESIQNTIFESPHKYNHIYHVIDAADFPMSLIPGLHRYFNLSPQRSSNRRSRTGKYYHGRKTEVSFIITRSDLLAPLKIQVDSLIPYLVSVLRDALVLSRKNIRLGNVRCVSSKRGWWTKELKEDIWNRGGGGWMVGKVNVGKSQLFECVFPKGRRGIAKQDGSVLPMLQQGSEKHSDAGSTDPIQTQLCSGAAASHTYGDSTRHGCEPLDSSSLLPPLPPETDYPAMPLVSALPGTTASPIRVPFGNGKGELVDLPGLTRGDLELYVQEPYRSSLVMRSRVLPEQQVIKPGQSLLLGGFIRITPVTPGVIVLAYAFTPILSHLTSTEKAIGIQTQEQESGVQNICNPGVGMKINTAGRFPLKWDVTRERSGPITDRSAAGINVHKLPYRVFSTDILIEGCGWVELVAQVRKKKLQPAHPTGEKVYNSQNVSSDVKWPEVEVFSPEGNFIGNRRPLGAWVIGVKKKRSAGTKGRPRPSMKGIKKKMKILRRTSRQ